MAYIVTGAANRIKNRSTGNTNNNRSTTGARPAGRDRLQPARRDRLRTAAEIAAEQERYDQYLKEQMFQADQQKAEQERIMNQYMSNWDSLTDDEKNAFEEYQRNLQHGGFRESRLNAPEVKTTWGDLWDEYLQQSEREETIRSFGNVQTPFDKAQNGSKNIGRMKDDIQNGIYYGDTTGRYGKGNIDLNDRPVVHNKDGSVSTVRSFSTNIDGKEVLLPTVIDGKIISKEEAIRHYEETGENLGIFDTPEEADAYARRLSDRMGWKVEQGGGYTNSSRVSDRNNKLTAEDVEDFTPAGKKPATWREQMLANRPDPADDYVYSKETELPAMERSTEELSHNAQLYVDMIKNAVSSGKGMKEIKAAQEQALQMFGLDAAMEAQPLVNDIVMEFRGEKEPATHTYRTLNRPFNEVSAWDQLADPDSQMSQNIDRTYNNLKKAENALNRERFMGMLNLMDTQGRISGAYGNLGSWLGDIPEEVRTAMSYEQAQKDIQNVENARRMGLMNGGNDPASMDRRGRADLRRQKTDENAAIRSVRIPGLREQIAGLQESKYRTEEEFREEYNDGYEAELKKYDMTEEQYSFQQYMTDVILPDIDKEIEMRENRITAAEAQIRNNERTLEQIKRYDRLDEGYGDLMNPAVQDQRKQQLQQEIDALQAEYDQRLAEKGHEANRNGEMTELFSEITAKKDELAELEAYNIEGEGPADASFHEEYDRGQTTADITAANTRRQDGKKADNSIHGIYSFINGGKEYEFWRKGNGQDWITSEYQGAMAMLPEEKERFNELYNAAVKAGREPTEAQAFLDGMQPYLNQRLRTYEELSVKQTARRLPVGSSVADLMMTATMPYQAAGTILGRLAGDKSAEDPYSWRFATARAAQDIEGQVAGDLGDAGGFVYKAAMSGLKNFVRGLTAMGAGAAAPAVTLAEFAGEAFYTSYQQKLEETGNADASMVYALVDAGISTLFEVASVEKLFSDPTDMLQYVLQNMGAEMSEELFEGVFSPYIHEMIDGSNEWKERADKIIQDGGYTDGSGNWVEVTPENANEAMAQAMREKNASVLESVASAAISSGGAAMFGATRNAMDDSKAGKFVLDQGKQKGMTWKERSGREIDNARKIVNPALQMPESTESNKLAKKLEQDMQDGKKLDKRTMGKLVRAIAAESNEEIGNIARNILGEDFMKRLRESGLKTGEASKVSQALLRVITTNTLSAEDKFIIDKYEEAGKIMDEFADSEARRILIEKTKPFEEARKSVMDVVTGPIFEGMKTADVSERMNNALKATDEEISRAQGKRTGNPTEVVAGGFIGDIVGFGSETYEEKVEGENKKFTTATVTISDGNGGTKTFRISDVKATTDAGAKVLQYMTGERGLTIGSELGTTLVRIAGEQKNLAASVTDAVNIMWAEMTGRKAQANSLSAEAEKEIRSAVARDIEVAEKERLKNWREIRTGEGRTVYNGKEYGTKDFNDAVNEAAEKLGKDKGNQLKQEALIIGSMAKSMGTDVELYYDEESSARQGVFYGGKNGAGIRINLAGTYTKEGAHRSAVATFAHEVTHNLEANSPQAYRALRSFVLQNLDRMGINLEAQLKHIMENYAAHGETIDLNGAIAEIVAMGCEQVLTNDKVIAQLKEQDPTLHGRMKTALRRVLDRIRGVKGDVYASSSRYAKAMWNVSDELGRKWMAAYQEARGAESTGEGSEKQAYSYIGNDADTGFSIYLSNYAEGTPRQIKQKEFIENIQNVFSRKPVKLELKGYDGKGKRTIYAQFDPAFDSSNVRKTDAGKLAYNKKVLSNPENRVRLNLAGDLQHILQESENYDSRADEKGNAGILQWHYFNDDIYYVAQGSDTMEPYKIDISIKEKEDGSFVYTYEAIRDKNRQTKKLRVMEVMNSVNTGRTGESASASAEGRTSGLSANDNGKESTGYPPVKTSINETAANVNTDEEYAQAVENGDLEKATQMLMDKLSGTEGIIPFMAPHWDAGKDREIARLIKKNVPDAVAKAAADMSKFVPANAVLIPMPDRTGKVTDGTDTMVLAKAIGEITGRPVVAALEGKGHESRHEAKARDEKGASQQELGFRQAAELPEGTFPIFVDNIVGSGITADAARMAIGGGITLAYAKTARSKGIEGLKNAIVTYDRNKNLIPLSERFDISKRDTRYSILDDEYMETLNSGDMKQAQYYVDDAAAENGYTITAYHGTGRADRVGTVFLPERATSGPMAFFTDTREIAEGYARDKQDTSIAYDDEYGDYYNQFRVKTKNGKTIPVGKLWNTLSYAEKKRITEAAKHIKLDDEAEEIIWDDNAKTGIGNFDAYTINLHKGNSIDALIDGWLEGGTLWNREGEFLKVLELAGIKDVIWMNPDYREEKVYDVYLKIQNPFVVSEEFNNDFLEKLEKWWGKQDQDKYNKLTASADLWDKNNRTLDQWIEMARDNIENGYTSVWTSIPDAVTDFLKSQKYDGIKDDGGKGGGMGHTVWIPFTSEQIKSADPVTYDENGDIIPPSERFNSEKKDIRWSIMDESDIDTRAWMDNVQESALSTEAEKQLLRNYKSLRMKAQLDRERIRKVDEEIRKLQEMQGANENRGPESGTPARAVTVNDVLKENGITLEGVRLRMNGTTIGTLKSGVLNIYDKYKDIKTKLTDSGAFKYDNLLNVWTTTTQNIHADGERDIRNRLEAQRRKRESLQTALDRTNDQLAKITSDKGFGGMMHRQQRILNDFVYGRTQAEVHDSVVALENSVEAITKRIEENRKRAEELEKSGIVERFRKLLGTTTAEQTARELKKEYNSTWTAKEIQGYLDPIILKMTAGEDFQQDVETLAGILVNSNRDNVYEELSALRGLTITLGKGAQAELRAQNSSMKEVRARLAGTGITVKFGERTSLEADIEDLRAEYPSMPDFGDEKNALGNFVDWIDGMKSQSAANEFYEQRIAEAMALITGKAAGAAKGIYMPNDTKAQKQVLAMMEFVRSLNAETQQAQADLQAIAEDMEKMKRASRAAGGLASTLTRDVASAIEYFNRTAAIAADQAKAKTKKDLIEQLRSDYAQKIAKNNEEWRAQIERDREARKQAEENAKHRNQINTALKRMMNLLKNPKGTKNIPEYMQGLARETIGQFIRNDLAGGRRLTRDTMNDLQEAQRLLAAWEKQDGAFKAEDLNAGEEVVSITMMQDLQTIYEGITAWNDEINGKNKLDTLQQRGEILRRMAEAVGEIYSAVKAEQEVQIGNRRVAVEDAAYKVAQGTEGKAYREWTGKLGGAIRAMHKAIVSGNMTPEYFFRTIGNEGLNDLWENYHWAENRNGLELKKAQTRLDEIAKKHGFRNWDMGQKITLELERGGTVNVKLGQLMSLWATWKREKTLGPAMSEHLTKGGFYAEQDLKDGMLGRTVVEKRAHRVTEEDMKKVQELLTEEQRAFIDDVVGFMSRDMSELGNQASMAAYGIRLYKESYYFPFQMWDGIKSRKSNDAGGAAAAQDRAFHPSFSKTRLHGANNAIVIGDFMQTAADHIAGMINYATMGLANESMQKVLNQQTAQGPYETKRNTRAILEEAYGREAMQYLSELQVQLNGGAVKISKTFYDKAISLFRKNAVAGSLSVALQQPLSYIRAAMLINPKYMTKALMTQYWNGAYKELIAHSGVAVIKDMGRFDMNAGQSAREYLLPDGKESTGHKIWTGIGEKATILPEKMDAWTWTRMWVAVKAEQHAEHPEMDVKSDAFLDLCGERFNEVMRRTQVYDSILVRSANMRSQHPAIKSITSFMAEPTLTLNVLADAVRSAKSGEKGGKMLLAKAGATFMLSAVLQAAVKGLMGSGRNPDKEKTWWENFLYRFFGSLATEANPVSLIPGYNDAVTLLKDGKLEDDAMGAIGKMWTAFTKTKDVIGSLINGEESKKGLYRDFEDSVAQLAQMFTNIPAKNLMRDARAMWNFFIEPPYAERESSGAVIRNQAKEAFLSADTLLSAALKMAGYKTTNAAYYEQIYEAKKAGNEQKAQDLIDYLINGKGVEKKAINTGVNSIAKKDDSARPEERFKFLQENEAGSMGAYVLDLYRKGEISREEAERMYREANPKAKDEDVLKALDKVEYELAGGESENYNNYTRLKEAMDRGDEQGIEEARAYLTEHGFKESAILSTMKSHIKERYRDGEISREEAENLYKKYDPEMDGKSIMKALDEVDYERSTGEDVESFSNYTLIEKAIDEGNTAAWKEQKAYLARNGFDELEISEHIENYIINQFKDEKLTKAEAERKIKAYAPKVEKNEVWWKLDRAEFKKTTKKDPGSQKYYRLWDAMDRNSANDIGKAISGMTAHGILEKNIIKEINGKCKQKYLAASDKEKLKIRDAMEKAYKKLGLTAKDADKTIRKWR